MRLRLLPTVAACRVVFLWYKESVFTKYKKRDNFNKPSHLF
jgi:hypothetical protein